MLDKVDCSPSQTFKNELCAMGAIHPWIPSFLKFCIYFRVLRIFRFVFLGLKFFLSGLISNEFNVRVKK